MLAEKFFLLLETLISRIASGRIAMATDTYPDGSPKVRSQTRLVPIRLPEAE
jgi:hypothetical protein